MALVVERIADQKLSPSVLVYASTGCPYSHSTRPLKNQEIRMGQFYRGVLEVQDAEQ